MIRRPPRSSPLYSSAASDVYKRQAIPCAASTHSIQRIGADLIAPSAVSIALQNISAPGLTTTVACPNVSNHGSRLCAASGNVTPCSVTGCSNLSEPKRREAPAANTMAATSPGSAPESGPGSVHGLGKAFLVERHAPQALAGQREHRVGNRRCDRRRARFADAGGQFTTCHDMYLDPRHFGKAQRRVVMEIRLHHAAVFQRDRTMQGG